MHATPAPALPGTRAAQAAQRFTPHVALTFKCLDVLHSCFQLLNDDRRAVAVINMEDENRTASMFAPMLTASEIMDFDDWCRSKQAELNRC